MTVYGRSAIHEELRQIASCECSLVPMRSEKWKRSAP